MCNIFIMNVTDSGIFLAPYSTIVIQIDINTTFKWLSFVQVLVFIILRTCLVIWCACVCVCAWLFPPKKKLLSVMKWLRLGSFYVAFKYQSCWNTWWFSAEISQCCLCVCNAKLHELFWLDKSENLQRLNWNFLGRFK